MSFVRSAVRAKDPEEFDKFNEKLIKYEGITDKIEYEIAAYLNEVSQGELSAASGLRIKAMYRVIGEMESIGDSGEAIGRMLKRSHDHGKWFGDEMVAKLEGMMDRLDVAMKTMVDYLTSPMVFLKDVGEAEKAEDGINDYRNILREEHIINCEREDYNYQTGVFYMDIVQEIEKIGDFVINIAQSQLEASA